MRVVVTGAAGFIGSHLCEGLLDDGHEVIGVDGFVDSYARPMKERNLRELPTREGFHFVEGDLRTMSIAPLLAGTDVVVNEAAMAGLMRSWAQTDLYVSCNVTALQRLLEACRSADIKRFIHISTSSVYGRWAAGGESLPTQPVSPYGVTKLTAEHLVGAYFRTFGLPAAILRYFSVYGPRQRPDMAYHHFIETLRRDQPITVYGDGQQTRSNTYIDDCVRGTIDAIDGAVPGEIYNIGGGQVISLLDAIHAIARELDVEPQLSFAPARAGDQQHTHADTTKAHAAFGYQPRVPPEVGLQRQVAWHLEQAFEPTQAVLV